MGDDADQTIAQPQPAYERWVPGSRELVVAQMGGCNISQIVRLLPGGRMSADDETYGQVLELALRIRAFAEGRSAAPAQRDNASAETADGLNVQSTRLEAARLTVSARASAVANLHAADDSATRAPMPKTAP